MRRTSLWIAILGLLMMSAAASGQTAFADHGPEVQRLRYFLGNWKVEKALNREKYGVSTAKGTARGEALGGAFIVITAEEDNPVGHMKHVSIYGYDPAKKVFVHNVFTDSGHHAMLYGKVEGKTWTWTSLDKSEINKKWVYQRFTLIELSPTSFSYVLDFSEDGKQWTNVMECKATKLKDDGDSGSANPGR